MRRSVLTKIIGILAGVIWLYGCGSEPLDEMGQRYTAILTVVDNEEDTLQVDTVQDLCDGEPESYSDTLGTITINVAPDAAGITLQRYSIDYIPLGSPDSTGALFDPPLLVSPETAPKSFSVRSGESDSLTITLVSIDTKNEFNIGMGWLYEDGLGNWVYEMPDPGELEIARYSVRVTLYFEDITSDERVITVYQTVYLSDYNNC